jgi:hypothetical protein
MIQDFETFIRRGGDGAYTVLLRKDGRVSDRAARRAEFAARLDAVEGHTAEQIDDIIENPDPERSGYLAGRGRSKGRKITLLTDRDGHWVKLDEAGRVIAASNRYLPLSHGENDPGDLIAPLED